MAAATSPWWMVRGSHAQRAKKLVFWHLPNFTPLADELQKQQVYEFAKQAGLKDTEVEYATVANEQAMAKLTAGIEAGNPPDVMRLYESNVQFYAAGGHLIDLHDQVHGAHVDAQLQAGGSHHRAQRAAFQCLLDLAPLLPGNGSVVGPGDLRGRSA